VTFIWYSKNESDEFWKENNGSIHDNMINI